MSNESGLSVSKPVAVWNKYKSIKADFKELFKSLGKAAINTALGKWDSVATDIVDASTAIGLAETPAEVAQQFVREVHRKVDKFNSRETRLQVLIRIIKFIHD
ncbi:hypothetical protein BV372_21280 [Nostoc sp. T09]|uniref:hypothetical protein n=1 Tax=Nostoc sp. T09 TaxID=1932621 RepID=UPI000A37D950|nr:hypothetical protein [Nostoc sp. T09]OUL30654.1 hypothetical protein BV372_21280 [Nostoc sp. T09]